MFYKAKVAVCSEIRTGPGLAFSRILIINGGPNKFKLFNSMAGTLRHQRQDPLHGRFPRTFIFRGTNEALIRSVAALLWAAIAQSV
jgi:hypothetical protein